MPEIIPSTSPQNPEINTYQEAQDELWQLVVEQSIGLQGTAESIGAKNAVLVIMASLLLTDGVSVLHNVPNSADVQQMILLLQDLGAPVNYDLRKKQLTVDTTTITGCLLKPEIMKKMRASVLVMGPLLARFGKADIALPGGCLIGARPIDIHLQNFVKMGVSLEINGEFLRAKVDQFKAQRLVLDYPSVGATENIIMAACLIPGRTTIINAAVEPEVLDLITILRTMGAQIEIQAPATIHVDGVQLLKAVEHTIMQDRLEAGALLLAAAITKGSISLPHARADHLDVFLLKLEQMGHHICVDNGITLVAAKNPKAVSFVTGPYPSFPTDLQAPMMAAQCLAEGKAVIHETVFENRLLHVRELQKMGAHITVSGDRATVTGVDELYGASVIATDIRASCALVLAGLAAKGTTIVTGVHHWKRGYDGLEYKLNGLGARIALKTAS